MTLTLGHLRPASAPAAVSAARDPNPTSAGADAFGSVMDGVCADQDAGASTRSAAHAGPAKEPVDPGHDNATDSTGIPTAGTDSPTADAATPAAFPSALTWASAADVASAAALTATTGATGATGAAPDVASAGTVPTVIAASDDAGAGASLGASALTTAAVVDATNGAVATGSAVIVPETGDAAAAGTPTHPTTAYAQAAAVPNTARSAQAGANAGVETSAWADAAASVVEASAATPSAATTSAATSVLGSTLAPTLPGAAPTGAAQHVDLSQAAQNLAAPNGTAVAPGSRSALFESVQLRGTDADAPTAPAVSALATAVPAALSTAATSTPAATPVTAAAPAAVPLTGQIMKPLFSLTSAAPGEHVLTISVTPDNLGPVTVRAHVTGEGIRVELFAPTDLARDALRAILPDLRRDLAGSGLNAQLDLSSNDQAENPNDSRQRRPEGDGRNPGSRAPDGRAPDTPPQSRAARFGSTHTIDVLA